MAQRTCQNCGGTKFIAQLDDKTKKYKKITCPACKGKGYEILGNI